MKKVLVHLQFDDLSRGGAESILFQISYYLALQGAEVHVVFLKPRLRGDWEVYKGKNWHLHYGKGRKFQLLWFLAINFWRLRKLSFDISFTSIVEHTAIFGLLKHTHMLKIKTIIGRESTSIFKRFHGIKLLQKRLLYYIGYPFVDILICQTTCMKEQLLEHLPWLQKKANVCVIPNPVDFKKIREMEKEATDTFNWRPYIVAAGRMIPEKGFDVLLCAFKMLSNDYPELKLVILGDGKLRSEIVKLAKELVLSDKLVLTGIVKNVYPYFRQAKMCVVSSRIEGFPNVLLQMMSQNEKVVSTLCAGDIDKIKGLYTCPTCDETALYKAMKDCLMSDTRCNRALFDEELESRTIDKFVTKVLEQAGQ